jgi:type VI secretion system ImpC/EvpB family protein
MLGAIASQAGAPLLAAAESSLLGCDSLRATPDPRDWQLPEDDDGRDWQSLRASPIAPWIGLALPRVLLRLPYGAKTDPLDALRFEELGLDAEHESYLWGNPALACALLIGQSFLDAGWDMQLGDRLELGDLPAHIVERDGEKRMQACAELYLSERAGEAMLERGLMPLMSYRNRNAVRVLRMQSLSQPLQALAGCWR